MIKNRLFTLLLLLCSAGYVYAQTFAGTSFEEPAAVGGSYIDTGNSLVDHDLVNNPGQPLVDYTSAGGEIGFDATYITGGDVGLTDGDFVGVTNFTGSVGSYIDGTQGYQLSDTDGTMLLCFDAVSLIGRTNPTLDMYYFLASTGWETTDSIRIWVEVDGGVQIDLLNTFGQDIDNLGIEGAWTQLTANLTGFTTATLKILFASNSGSEAIYIDHITFSEGGIVAGCNISTTFDIQSCDPATNDFSFSITPTALNGSVSGYTYSINGFLVSGGPFPYDSIRFIGSFDSDGMTNYEIAVQDAGDPTCTDTLTIFSPNSCLAAGCTNVDLVLTGVVDADLPGGLPKALEFYVLNNITDLSTYGIGRATNGTGPSLTPDYTFPADAAMAGDYIYASTDSIAFADFFGFNADYITSAISINGDDAIELYCGGIVYDIFGDVNMDGSGTAWEYTNGWAYRCTGGPDGSTFVPGNWNYSGPGGLAGEGTNAAAVLPVPIGTYPTTTCISTCPVDLTDADLGGGNPNNVPAGTYQVSNSITSSGVIAPATTVIFDAGTIMCLEAGFSVEPTAEFSAIIGGCTP